MVCGIRFQKRDSPRLCYARPNVCRQSYDRSAGGTIGAGALWDPLALAPPFKTPLLPSAVHGMRSSADIQMQAVHSL